MACNEVYRVDYPAGENTLLEYSGENISGRRITLEGKRTPIGSMTLRREIPSWERQSTGRDWGLLVKTAVVLMASV